MTRRSISGFCCLLGLSLALSACAENDTGGLPDSSSRPDGSGDSSTTDSSTTDSSTPDSSATDSSATDTGTEDDATVSADASEDAAQDAQTDAAVDSGPVERATVINEFVFNHTSIDTNEFIELYGQADTDLSSLTLVIVEGDDGSTTGEIRYVEVVGTTDDSGFWSTAILNSAFQNGSQVLLLVSGFTGVLDGDLDVENDGTLDSSPWDEVLDAVAINDGNPADFTFGFFTLPQDFDGGEDPVGGASRIPDGTDTDDVTDWVRNDFDGTGLPDFGAATAEAGEAINTRGTANRVQP